METAVRQTAIVQPGGKIEMCDQSLPVGKEVEIIVLVQNGSNGDVTTNAEIVPKRSLVDILAEAPGGLLFKTAEEVDAYIRAERDAWER